MPRPKADREKLTLRLPPEIHLQIKASAAENDRSLNAEIVARLRSSIKGWQQDPITHRRR